MEESEEKEKEIFNSLFNYRKKVLTFKNRPISD
jgi:hypothetical protein